MVIDDPSDTRMAACRNMRERDVILCNAGFITEGGVVV
jgi:hypothetical protein